MCAVVRFLIGGSACVQPWVCSRDTLMDSQVNKRLKYISLNSGKRPDSGSNDPFPVITHSSEYNFSRDVGKYWPRFSCNFFHLRKPCTI